MEGERQPRARGKQTQRSEKTEGKTTESDPTSDHEAVSLQVSIAAILSEIKAIRADVKTELDNFREAFIKEVKLELVEFKEEVNQQLSDISAELKDTVSRVEEVEQRVSDVEDWSGGTKEAISRALSNQELIHERLLDMEARARRNNLRIFGIQEGAEGGDMLCFVDNFLKTELTLPENMSLGIQRCHRASGPPPPADAHPRSVVINFQEFKVKDTVLRTAWKQREVKFNDKRVFFDNDYPPEIQKKRRAYAPIRKMLKEKNLRFQTPPPAKLRVFYDSGPVTYNSATEASEDLKKRGLAAEFSGLVEETLPKTTTKKPVETSWMKQKRDKHRESVRNRLQNYRLDSVSK